MKTTIETFPPREADLREAFLNQVSSFPEGHKIKNCLQCGTCTGTCPVSYAMDLTPRQIIAMFRAGRLEEILRSRAIWLCASCYSCTVRCPVGIRVTDSLYALKRVAMERDIHPRKFPAHVMSRSFTNNIMKYGRNYELGLAIRYFTRANFVKLFTQIGNGLTLIRKKRLPLLPQRIKRVGEVRAIIERANQFAEA